MWNFRRANWARYRRLVEQALGEWETEVDMSGELDVIYMSWIYFVLKVAEEVIPKRKVSGNSKPFVSHEMSKFSKSRKRALRRKSKRNTPVLRARMRQSRAEMRAELDNAQLRAIENLLEFPSGASREDLWDRFKKITRSVSKISTVLKDGEDFLISNADKVRKFNSFFAKRGEEKQGDNFSHQHKIEVEKFVAEFELDMKDDSVENDLFSEDEVLGQVKSLKPSKAIGVDGIHSNFLLYGGDTLIRTLTKILNESFRRGRLYDIWRVAEIVPIPKVSSANKVEEFRPISLLSIVCKIIEGILALRINNKAEDEGWFPDFIGGFRPKRGTTDQLLTFTHKISEAIRKRHVCATAFLDVSAAYDSCFRAGVIKKLIQKGINGRLLKWLMAFLSDRKARVKFEGETSDVCDHPYGLPQGSRLSPILFNVFMSDIVQVQDLTDAVDLGVYADDVRVSAFGQTASEAASKLSSILLTVALWARKNRVRFDIKSKKCGYMFFASQKQPDERVTFGHQQLNRLSSAYKYLGVWFSESLSFTEHIKRVKGKAWRALHDIRRVVGDKWGATLPVVMKLYTALVRPILEYACEVWDTASSRIKSQLDGVQRAALLSATGAQPTTSTAALQAYCGEPSLQDRRDYLTASRLQRVIRLRKEHPIFACYKTWCDDGRPHSALSVFPRAYAMKNVLCRFANCSLGSDEFAEPTRRKTRQVNQQVTKLLPKDTAKQRHLNLCRQLSVRNDTLVVYTDGSAIPNPGRIGLGVTCVSVNFFRTISEPIGIGSNLTAELCALRRALGEALSLVRIYLRVFVFSDCAVAVDLANGKIEPSGDFALVNDIRNLLREARKHFEIYIKWVPAHVGVPGNERANTAAQDGANAVRHIEPLRGQPLIPLRSALATLRRGLFARWQESWIATSAPRYGDEHLFRIKPGVARQQSFYSGNREQQTLLARLRFGHCRLAASSARLYSFMTAVCECHLDVETVEHFLLSCPRYEIQRVELMKAVREVFHGRITEEVLLGGSSERMRAVHKVEVAEAVYRFVLATGADI